MIWLTSIDLYGMPLWSRSSSDRVDQRESREKPGDVEGENSGSRGEVRPSPSLESIDISSLASPEVIVYPIYDSFAIFCRHRAIKNLDRPSRASIWVDLFFFYSSGGPNGRSMPAGIICVTMHGISYG